MESLSGPSPPASQAICAFCKVACLNAVCEHMYVSFFEERTDWLDVAEHPRRKGQHRQPDDVVLLSPQGPRLLAQAAAATAAGPPDNRHNPKSEAKLQLLLRALGMARHISQSDAEGMTIADLRELDAATFRAFLPGLPAHDVLLFFAQSQATVW